MFAFEKLLYLSAFGIALLLFAVNSSGVKAEEFEGQGTVRTIKKQDLSSLYSALTMYTGYSLGSALTSATSSEMHICAAKMRYGDHPDSDIAQLFCSNRKEDTARLIKFWVNFTSPERGHKAWKINLSLPGDRHSNSAFISALMQQFGEPQIDRKPLSYKWKIGNARLFLREDQYGLQLELWDLSLHTIA